ncbi:hypothetical protein DFH07DRAFT_701746, partial [Mycena maculata]
MSWGLFGSLSVQPSVTHISAFPNDRQFIKGLIYTVYLIDFVAILLFTRDTFSSFGYGFTDPSALLGVGFMTLVWLKLPIVRGL